MLMGLKMNNHQRTVFVVMYIARDSGSVIVGVYDDYRDADDKRQEEPERFVIALAPYFPSPPMEP
jgi:hypothetical protein